ncbi:MAG: ECF transporter S component [Erysipelotrichaceae bacterium]|nr:ECF transporter S component [Erysipelotrichaceae bacterium]
MNKKTHVTIVIAMGIVCNVVGAFIAMNFSIPLYMDSIGTILVAGLLGPKYAMLTGILGSLTSGMTFDMYSLYFAPVQLLTGFFAGTLYHTKWLQGKYMPIGAILVGVPTSIASAFITALLFGGLTSSSSSLIVMALNHLGLNLVVSVFIVQVITDYFDKLLAVFFTQLVIERGHLYKRWRNNGKI